MTLPANAQIGAAPNFSFNLEEARTFFSAQDAATAKARFGKLKSELREMKRILSWAPAGGRPARFLNGQSAQAQLRTVAVLQLAAQVGLPSLREYVVAQHVVLYAHSDSEVVLLALKHHRQLAYSANQ
jgi:hypothetical protein